MNISSHVTNTRLSHTMTQTVATRNNNTDTSGILVSMQEQSLTYTKNSVEFQSALLDDTVQKNHEAFQSFLSDIGYNGQSLAELSQRDAAVLVSDEGFFGMSQTAERIANFVIAGAGGDESMLRSGREGMLQGFKEAEALWGGELPKISQQTMELATKMVDDAMHGLGYSIVNEAV